MTFREKGHLLNEYLKGGLNAQDSNHYRGSRGNG
jgi:hypothetical protein